jgi:phenylpropionate dioxygenase-like ring-hydroxylating dioxygenase large terminal subunit
VTHVGGLRRPGDFVTATVAGAPVLVCVDETGQLRAFHNVLFVKLLLLM